MKLQTFGRRAVSSLLLCFILLNGFCQSPQVSSGKLTSHPHFNSRYIGERMVRVWLPDDYQPNRKYQVLYAQDGQNLWDAALNWTRQEWIMDEVMGRLQQQKKIRPTIVVAIDNAGVKRHAEYFPQKPFEALAPAVQDSLLKTKWGENPLFASPIYSDRYLKFLVEELKPFIDSAYSTLPDREHNFMIGSSMGGLISLYAVCEYPDVFGGAICMSTHWPGIFEAAGNPIPGAFYAYLRKQLPDPKTHRFYFDYGTQTLDADYGPYQHAVDNILRQRGYGPKNWETLRFEGAAHVESSWAQRLHIPIRFMLQ